MPIPQPTPTETKDEFISRCMADPKMNEEYQDESQRFAVCNSSYLDTKFDEIRTHLYNNKN